MGRNAEEIARRWTLHGPLHRSTYQTYSYRRSEEQEGGQQLVMPSRNSRRGSSLSLVTCSSFSGPMKEPNSLRKCCSKALRLGTRPRRRTSQTNGSEQRPNRIITEMLHRIFCCHYEMMRHRPPVISRTECSRVNCSLTLHLRGIHGKKPRMNDLIAFESIIMYTFRRKLRRKLA